MFGTVQPDTERPASAIDPGENFVSSASSSEPVPLSQLRLDIEQPGEGWAAFLAGRGIEVVSDDIGRPSIARADARRLFAEQREHEARKAEMLRAADEAAEEYDRQRRAQIWRGVSADMLPVGATPASVMLAAAKDAQPKRRTPLEEALSNDGGITYHSYAQPDEE